MTVAQAAVVNEALETIGSQAQITDLNDGSVAGNAAGVIYAPLVQMLARQLDPDFARRTVTLTIASGSLVPPYAYKYTYPADCLRTRQVRPQVGNYDPLDPQPVRWAVAYDGTGKVIASDLQTAALVYTTSAITETQWDAIFRETVVTRVASPLAMAIAGRPDFARALLEEAAQMAQMADGRDDGA